MLQNWAKIVFVCVAFISSALAFDATWTNGTSTVNYLVRVNGSYVEVIRVGGEGPYVSPSLGYGETEITYMWPGSTGVLLSSMPNGFKIYANGAPTYEWQLIAAVSAAGEITSGQALPVETRTVNYSVEVTNTSVGPRTARIEVNGTVIETLELEPYTSGTMTGSLTAADGSLVAVTGNDVLTKRAGGDDPYIVGPTASPFQRSYLLGPPSSQMVNCTVVVQANNLSTADATLWAKAGTLKLCEVVTRADAQGHTWTFAKFSGPLPIGSDVSVSGSAPVEVISSPSNPTVAANNAEFLWVVSVTQPAFRAPYDASWVANTSTTTYSNGQAVTTTQGPGGVGSAALMTTSINTNSLPVTGQTATAPSGVTGATATQGTPGVTTISGSGQGLSLGDSAALAAIAANTAQVAQNTAVDTSGLTGDMPQESRLANGTFSADAETQAKLNALNPIAGKGIPAGVAPQVSLPFGELGVDGLSDQSMNFGDTHLGGWVTTIRGFLLALVSFIFVFHTIKLISKTAGNI